MTVIKVRFAALIIRYVSTAERSITQAYILCSSISRASLWSPICLPSKKCRSRLSSNGYVTAGENTLALISFFILITINYRTLCNNWYIFWQRHIEFLKASEAYKVVFHSTVKSRKKWCVFNAKDNKKSSQRHVFKSINDAAFFSFKCLLSQFSSCFFYKTHNICI